MLRSDMVRAEFMRRLDGTVQVESRMPVKGQGSSADERCPWPGPRLPSEWAVGEAGFQSRGPKGLRSWLNMEVREKTRVKADQALWTLWSSASHLPEGLSLCHPTTCSLRKITCKSDKNGQAALTFYKA